MMVYAPNGDLFVSSPAANNITVLRDANNDGVFEARSVYAAGTPPAGRAATPPPAPAGGPRHRRGPCPGAGREPGDQRCDSRCIRTCLRTAAGIQQPRTRNGGRALRDGVP